jgi:sulfur relay (sulfurtransferase) DsrC/TusE family protein
MDLSIRTLENNFEDIKKYLEKNLIKITSHIVCREYGKQNGHEHYHYHIETDNQKAKINSESTRRGIRRMLFKYYNKKNYYVKAVKDIEKHKIYVSKDGDIVHTSFKKEDIEALYDINEEIEKDKQLPVYIKLYNRIKEKVVKEKIKHSMNEIALNRRLIIKYILDIYMEWGKAPPSKSLMFTYVNFFQLKEGYTDVVVEQYI